MGTPDMTEFTPNHTRVENVMTSVCKRPVGPLVSNERCAASAMAIRILDRLQPERRAAGDVDALVAVFISLKTECVSSPMSHTTLIRLTGLPWPDLETRELEILTRIGWRLYEGALTCP